MIPIMNHQLPPPTHLEHTQSFSSTSGRYFEEEFDVALKRSNSSQIFSTENLNLIEQLIENLDQDTLVEISM
jgi:hypothetical protein